VTPDDSAKHLQTAVDSITAIVQARTEAAQHEAARKAAADTVKAMRAQRDTAIAELAAALPDKNQVEIEAILYRACSERGLTPQQMRYAGVSHDTIRRTATP
jgi:hypothetical protein